MNALAAAILLWSGPAPLAVGDTSWDKPTITPFLVQNTKEKRAAVVVCPGGGYGFLADDHEGKQAAEFLNKLGIHAFVLKSRIVKDGRTGPLGKAPLLDAQRAIRMVRAKADEWNIDVKKVGVMGFSAGGHLASTAGTHYDEGDPMAKDAIDKLSCKPDYIILAYPVVNLSDGVGHRGSRDNLLGKNATAEQIQEFSNDLHVNKNTSPTFLFHTNEDNAVIPENSIRFYQACKKNGVPVELHIYEKGKHGIGLGNDPKWNGNEKSVSTWPDRLADWLKRRDISK
jgi:acetyl esterase/lipase